MYRLLRSSGETYCKQVVANRDNMVVPYSSSSKALFAFYFNPPSTTNSGGLWTTHTGIPKISPNIQMGLLIATQNSQHIYRRDNVREKP